MRRHTASMILAFSMMGALAHAQSIDPNNKFAWGENIGFLNFADAGDPIGTQGVFANTDHLEGYIWGENIGWVHVGAGGGPYANTSGLNFGVNFSTRTQRLSGFAWGENIGWINLDDDIVYVGLADCPADLNNDGQLNFFDVSAFLSAYSAMNPAADFNNDGVFNFFDVSAFLTAYNAGCP